MTVRPFDTLRAQDERTLRFAGYAALFHRRDAGRGEVATGSRTAREAPLAEPPAPFANYTNLKIQGWQWQDGVDVPLVEQVESYLVTLGPIEAPLAMWTVDRPQLEIGAALLDELRAIAPGQPLRVRQRGTHALSLPLPICSLP